MLRISVLKRYTVVICELALLLVLVCFNFYQFNSPKITTGNAAARVLLAVGVPFHIGIPYTDLFEYAPPGLLAVLSTWIDLFGSSMYAYRALHVTLILTTGIALIAILRKICQNWMIEAALFGPLILILCSVQVQTDIFSIEMFGTTFALLGLTALLYIKHPVTKLAIGSGMLLMASQIKETYALCSLALLPYLVTTLKKYFFWPAVRIFVASLYGPLTVVAIVISYLVINDAVAGYRFVLQSKLELVQVYTQQTLNANLTSLFHDFTTMYMRFPIVAWALPTGALLCGIIWWSYHNFFETRWAKLFHGQIVERAATICLSIGVFAGFMIYGQISPGARMISVAIAIFFMIAVSLSLVPWPRNLALKLVLLIVLATALSPSMLALREYRYNVAPPLPYDPIIENKIITRVPTTDCILHLYGWEVPQTYIYTRRRPCSKYFLANLVINRPSRVVEYQKEVLAHPPAAILYNTEGTDLNIPQFDHEIINFTNVIAHCYTVDPDIQNYDKYFFTPVTLYWKNSNLSTELLRQCIRTFGFTR